ncbi:hypothetical protein GLAREA_09403 [Glarea lozoyensis ATCC 20868]|uniref:Uncharacterized protein n=1 Tax=Glarea lozoyensis (strain ATCC 20868 / MF5171) TaxID=1116229 RepID=S3DPC6_GLAL2|nr:uncharacterized protein GLAREA_09403 [Glarea lozoyensis ATCC 20868]EPE28283.1 hypothetical protein GLAREA_09403 [Glarea lozoyensis ATCC 20868]
MAASSQSSLVGVDYFFYQDQEKPKPQPTNVMLLEQIVELRKEMKESQEKHRLETDLLVEELRLCRQEIKDLQIDLRNDFGQRMTAVSDNITARMHNLSHKPVVDKMQPVLNAKTEAMVRVNSSGVSENHTKIDKPNFRLDAFGHTFGSLIHRYKHSDFLSTYFLFLLSMKLCYIMLGPATSITDFHRQFPPVKAAMAAPTDWVAFNAASTRISQYASQLAETVEAAAGIPTDIEVVQAELKRVEEQSINAMLLQLLQGLGSELKEMRQEMQQLKNDIREQQQKIKKELKDEIREQQQNTKRELKNDISGQMQKTRKDLQIEIDQTEKNLKWKMGSETAETKAEVAKMRNCIQTMTRDMQQSMGDMRSEMREVMKQLEERKTTNDDQPRRLGNSASQIRYASDSGENMACPFS